MARVKMTPDRLEQLGITMEDVRNYRKHMGTIRRCAREGGSKYKTKEDYDEYEGAAKWKHQNEAKEAKKRKRAERKNVTATVSKKRKGHIEVDGDSSSESSGTQKRQKVAAKKQGKAKVVVSDSSGGNDRGWKPSDSDHGEDKRRAKLYKKLKKVHRRPNMVPEAKADFNQSTLEDYDVRKYGSQGVKGVKCKAERPPTPSAKSGPSHVGEDGAAELGELFGQVLDEKLGVMKAELRSFIEDHVKGLAI
ncbi:hypothetical protein K1719_036629 [Acacia pycnantha]|nr:hypothetical protein K1719_036629 [Acacia pycnantha]